ncbi:MAG: LamG-like jellyroll fold domain-containing protein [bacterium]
MKRYIRYISVLLALLSLFRYEAFSQQSDTSSYFPLGFWGIWINPDRPPYNPQTFYISEWNKEKENWNNAKGNFLVYHIPQWVENQVMDYVETAGYRMDINRGHYNGSALDSSLVKWIREAEISMPWSTWTAGADARISAVVSAFGSRTGLYTYSLAHEEPIVNIAPENDSLFNATYCWPRVQYVANRIKQLDPNPLHKTYVVSGGAPSYGFVMSCPSVDIIQMDVYFFKEDVPNIYSAQQSALDNFLSHYDATMTRVRGRSTEWQAIIQSQREYRTVGDIAPRRPTIEEMRVQAYLALSRGSRGITSFVYGSDMRPSGGAQGSGGQNQSGVSGPVYPLLNGGVLPEQQSINGYDGLVDIDRTPFNETSDIDNIPAFENNKNLFIELASIGSTIRKLKHYQAFPGWNVPANNSAGIVSVSHNYNGDNRIEVGTFKRMDQGLDSTSYFILANRVCNDSIGTVSDFQSVSVVLQGNHSLEEQRSKQIYTGSYDIANDRSSFLLRLAPGEGKLFKIGPQYMKLHQAFNGNANDQSGSGNNGSIYGASFTPAASNLGLNFDGITDYVSIPNSSSLNPSAITLAAWIQPNTLFQDFGAGVICKGYGCGDEIYSIDIVDSKLRFYFWTNNAHGIVAPNPISGLAWISVVATYDGQTMILYLNGNEVARGTPGVSELAGNTHELTIGSRQSGNGEYDLSFNGLIDEVRMWDRALSASEILEFYNPQNAPPLTLTSPNGMQNMIVNSSHTITWTSTGIASINLFYTTNGGSSWLSIASNLAASSGSYIWTVPNTPSGNCLVKIVDVNNQAKYDESNCPFLISTPPASIVVTQPNGGETWWIGNSYWITWTSENVSSNVKIELSTDNGITISYLIAQNEANDGAFFWPIPSGIASSQCRILITAIDESAYDFSDNSFTIAQSGGVKIAQYSFDGNTLDESGNGNNGTIVGNAPYVTGRWGQALLFGNYNQYVSVPNTSLLNPGSISIAVCVNPSNPIVNFGAGVICKGNGMGGEIYCIDVVNCYRFYFWKGDAPSVLGPSPQPGWSSIVVTYDGSTMRFYYNGSLYASTSTNLGNLNTNDHVVSIGARQSGSSTYNFTFNGAIDAVRLYDYPLTSAQVLEYHNGTLAKRGVYEPDPKENVEVELPREYQLLQNYPNPFNGSTVIAYALPHDSYVRLSIMDLLGREVAILLDAHVKAGYHRVAFDADLAHLPSGVYLCRMQANAFVETRKLLYTK